jgi:hypothetical protein
MKNAIFFICLFLGFVGLIIWTFGYYDTAAYRNKQWMDYGLATIITILWGISFFMLLVEFFKRGRAKRH